MRLLCQHETGNYSVFLRQTSSLILANFLNCLSEDYTHIHTHKQSCNYSVLETFLKPATSLLVADTFLVSCNKSSCKENLVNQQLQKCVTGIYTYMLLQGLPSTRISGEHLAIEWGSSKLCLFNPLNTKRRLLYLKTQFVPRSKHFSSRLQKPISLCCKWYKSLFVLR